MTKRFLKDGLMWGFVLWLIGYVLGIVLFMLVPASMIGWIITPIGIIILLWVLFKKIDSKSFGYYFKLGLLWAAMAIVLDYIFIVKLFAPVGGYYKFDIYLYYALTLLLPLIVGWRKTHENK